MEIFQYIPFKSFVNSSFWYKLSDIKIDIDRLNDSPKPIYGFYTNAEAKNCLLEVDCTSFNEYFSPSKNYFVSHGILLNKNTIEEFKNCDKIDILKQQSTKIWENITNGSVLDNPSLLSNFFLLSFADLKLHKFYYWFCFPSPIHPILQMPNNNKKVKLLIEHFTNEKITQLKNIYFDTTVDVNHKSFFIIEEDDNEQLVFKTLKDKINYLNVLNNFKENMDSLKKTYFCFSDPSEYENPGWNLRMFIAFLYKLCPNLHSKIIQVISIRVNKFNIEKSLIYNVHFPVDSIDTNEDMKWIGWEVNDHEKLLPKMVNMGATMDSKTLADNSCNLNLKLMKWRLLPNLNLDIISKTKCLLIGAGTLGCGVARTLLGWGVTNVTFIDAGKVHYSNPVRQSLYTHEDAKLEKAKAVAACERLSLIHPAVNAVGHIAFVPMPGHPVGESTMQSTIDNIELLKKEIEKHDAVFLLTDSRESRWLPTMLGAYYDKIVINAALGFDSYVVTRHGSRKPIDNTECKPINLNINGLKCIPGNLLGCYFCNDITAPGNSLKDRTLDQQCTVTRPSVSNIASSIAVELLVAILQHPDQNLSPAYTVTGGNIENQNLIPEGLLGIIPHSIRGMMSNYEQIIPATEYFKQCIACSESVLSEYKKRENQFIIDVLNSTKYLEDLTGISEIGADIEHDIIAFDDDDEFETLD